MPRRVSVPPLISGCENILRLLSLLQNTNPVHSGGTGEDIDPGGDLYRDFHLLDGVACGEGIGGRITLIPQLGGLFPFGKLAEKDMTPLLTYGPRIDYGAASTGARFGLALEFRLAENFSIGGVVDYGYLPIGQEDINPLYSIEDCNYYVVTGHYSLVGYGFYIRQQMGKIGPFQSHFRVEIAGVQPSMSYKVEYLRQYPSNLEDFNTDANLETIVRARLALGVTGSASNTTGYFFEWGFTRLFARDRPLFAIDAPQAESIGFNFDANMIEVLAGVTFNLGTR